jgi:S1-C subfamily serine protease
MTVVDWVIVAFTVMLALQGYSRGFIVGVLSLVGFGAGALLGTRIGPLLLPGGSHSRYAPLFGLVGALLAGGVLATGFEGIGRRARRFVLIPGFRFVDGTAGALLTGCVGLGIAWIVGAVALSASDSASLRHDVRSSTILRELDRLLPPSGPILNALGRFDPLPSISGPVAQVRAPTRAILAAAGVRAAAPSVVRVIGSACGLGIEGSGWVTSRDLVVTNAHVVAGESDTGVQVAGRGSALPAILIAFDSRNDIAVLYVPGLDEPALRLATRPRSGTAAAILGYPEDGGYNVQPGRLGAAQETDSEDAYGRGPVVRDIASLRGLVRPGNSGGPMVDAKGQVIATIFAEITDVTHDQAGGLAVPNSIVARALAKARAHPVEVSSGPCAD